MTLATTIAGLKRYLARYDIEDAALAILTSDLWPRNWASSTKHRLFYLALLASGRPRTPSKRKRLRTYAEFRDFIDELYALSPTFDAQEDYVPELGWGEIRYEFSGRQYRIFSGTELADPVGQLDAFRVLYDPAKEELEQSTGWSPMVDFETCLQLQHDILEGIDTTTQPHDLDIEPGHLSLPTEAFWKAVGAEVTNFSRFLSLRPGFVQRFSAPPTKRSAKLTEQVLGSGNSSAIPLFLRIESEGYVPLNIRRATEVLIDYWATRYEQHAARVRSSAESNSRLAASMAHFVRLRFPDSVAFPLVIAGSEDGKQGDLLFSAAILSESRLFLIHVLPPCFSREALAGALSQLVPLVKESLELLGVERPILHLLAEGKSIQLVRSDSASADRLRPEILVALSEPSPNPLAFELPADLKADVFPLAELLALLDEIDGAEELAALFVFRSENQALTASGINSLLDWLGAARDTFGTLVGGARTPDWILLDPHWGSHLRYESLRKFWAEFPLAGIFGEARSWQVMSGSGLPVRFMHRQLRTWVVLQKSPRTCIFFSAPYGSLSHDEARTANFLAECAQDAIGTVWSVLQKHSALARAHSCGVHFFPREAVRTQPRFKHLRHLLDGTGAWVIDAGVPSPGRLGIRVVFDQAAVVQAFSETSNRSVEVKLVSEIVTAIDRMNPDARSNAAVAQKLAAIIDNKPRFKMCSMARVTAFPDEFVSWIPETSDFKQAKKSLAHLARSSGVAPGLYDQERAKRVLNTLRQSTVREINRLALPLAREGTVRLLMGHADGLMHRRTMDLHGLRASMSHEVDYARDERLVESQESFTKMHRNYRYLIEKLVLLGECGEKVASEKEVKYLLALVDWFFVIASASDAVHYEISPASVTIEDDYLITVNYPDGAIGRQKEFGAAEARLNLGLEGETIEHSPDKERVAAARLDVASREDLGFRMEMLGALGTVLSHWPQYQDGVRDAPVYSESLGEIIRVASLSVEGTSGEEIQRAIDFLILKGSDLLRVLNQPAPCEDLPVWEHKKRSARYSIRPIIQTPTGLNWAPYAVRQAVLLWLGMALQGSLPADIAGPALRKELEVRKQELDDQLEQEAQRVIGTRTPYALRGVKLHKIDKGAKHPADLGDYDVLAYLPTSNILLSVECKNLLPAFCLKDSKTLYEKMFGTGDSSDGHFGKIEGRQDYLRKKWSSIMAALKWPVPDRPPDVKSLYVTPTAHWWTQYPPKVVAVEFVSLERLGPLVSSFLAE